MFSSDQNDFIYIGIFYFIISCKRLVLDAYVAHIMLCTLRILHLLEMFLIFFFFFFLNKEGVKNIQRTDNGFKARSRLEI